MIFLIVYLVLAYGFTNIVVFGSIFKSFRDRCNTISPDFFGKLFSCPMCFSTWVGFGLSFALITIGLHTPMFYLGITPELVGVPLLLFLDGIFTSGGVWLIHSVQDRLER